MKISEMIAELEKIKEKEGDLVVYSPTHKKNGHVVETNFFDSILVPFEKSPDGYIIICGEFIREA